MANLVNSKLDNLLQQMKSLGVININTVDEMSTVFTKINLDNRPQIVTNNDCMVFFDTPTYNNNYITDLIIEYLTKYSSYTYRDFTTLLKFNNTLISKEVEIFEDIKAKLLVQTPKTKFYYCDSINVYQHYFNEKIVADNMRPQILTIKGQVLTKPKEIFVDRENLAPFNLKVIMKNILLLHDYNLNNQF